MRSGAHASIWMRTASNRCQWHPRGCLCGIQSMDAIAHPSERGAFKVVPEKRGKCIKMHQMDAWHTERPRSINIMLCPQATGMRGHSSNECEFPWGNAIDPFDAIFKLPLFRMSSALSPKSSTPSPTRTCDGQGWARPPHLPSG